MVVMIRYLVYNYRGDVRSLDKFLLRKLENIFEFLNE